ncbi:MAG: hypothetical protein CMB31_06830 [Euryarchaeota archaeon]|nr:hypothetical protein [Euryarchaeota archaeon]
MTPWCQIEYEFNDDSNQHNSSTRSIDPWTSDQPWGQFGGGPDRRHSPPAHAPDGGAGNGNPNEATTLGSILDPIINWKLSSDPIGTSALSTAIGNFSESINSAEGHDEECGGGSLFPVIVQTKTVGSNDHSFLRIIEGEDAVIAWEVDLGPTRPMKAGPIVADIDNDGKPEIIVIFDSVGTLNVELWSPELECTATGWIAGGTHSSQKIWTWSDEGLSLEHPQGAYTSGLTGDHHPTSQPVVADLDLDGNPEIAIPAISESTNTPVILSLSLPITGTPEENWRAEIESGTHPSDLTFATLGPDSAAVFFTTIENDDGLMWVWRLDGETGASAWSGGSSLGNLDGGASDSPRIRLPGPVVAQLDSDDAPELILTIPTDLGGNGATDGAEFVAIEATSASEIWSFNARDGYADAPPLVLDSDYDGVDDRVCWVTWRSTNTNRDAMAGCHDISQSSPVQRWYRRLEASSGNPNDEIAVSSPFWMDIDGSGEPEILVPYGRSIFAYDGDEGTSVAISLEWEDDLEVQTRLWSSPALADVDGDAILDIVIGDLVISHAAADVRPFLDGGGIEFNPTAPDPNEMTTITAYVENVGTIATDKDVDVILFADGIEIGRDRIPAMDPVSPSGNGNFGSINVDWSGGLGTHSFSMVIDPLQNLTETRIDNNQQNRTLTILEPYDISVVSSNGLIRIDPGASEDVELLVTNTGKNDATWTMEIDSSQLPENWTVAPLNSLENISIDSGESWTVNLRISAPSDALGSDEGSISLSLTPNESPNSTHSIIIPIEANRTRGISLRGPLGISQTTGWGIPGSTAHAWVLIENLGNAAETDTGITYGNTPWGNGMTLASPIGNSITSISLEPGEIQILSVEIAVPSNTPLGETISSTVEICIGSGSERECELINVEFIASDVVAIPSHHRTVPLQGIEWQIEGIFGSGDQEMEWDLANGGLSIQSGWVLSSTGDLEIIGDRLFAQSSSNSFSGTLILDLPEDAAPTTHIFSILEANQTHADLNLSLEVLQEYRASISNPNHASGEFIDTNMIQTETAYSTIVSFENTGNGEDSYALYGRVINDGNISNHDSIEISFPISTITLSPGSSINLPATIEAPAGTPARIPFTIEWEMLSLGNTSVSDSIQGVYEVQQDHQWSFEISDENYPFHENGENDTRIIGLPGETLEIPIRVINTGNHDDTLNLTASSSISQYGNDPLSPWIIEGAKTEIIDVNENQTLLLNITIPNDAWNGTILTINWQALAGDLVSIDAPSHSIEVGHTPSWKVIASGVDLDISPNGEIISMTVVQTGNLPAEPYANTYVSGTIGWNVSIENTPGILEPGQSGNLELNITPPSSAIAGQAVQLNIILRNGDGSGWSSATFPVRVDALRNHTLEGDSNWYVTNDGGFPLLWVTNHGNAPTSLNLQVIGGGNGWNLSYPDTIHLSIGETRGVPINLIPPNDEGLSPPTITVRTTDETGIQREMQLNPIRSERSWSNPPVIVGLVGDVATLSFFGQEFGDSPRIVGGNTLDSDGENWSYNIGESQSIDIRIGSTDLSAKVFSQSPNYRTTTCSSSMNGTIIESICIIGNDTFEMPYTLMITDDQGLLVHLETGIAAPDSIIMIYSNASWNPNVGTRSYSITVHDRNGIIIETSSKEYEIRDTEWNIGISQFETIGTGDDRKISLTTTRTNKSKIENVRCTVTYSSGSWELIQDIDMGGLLNPTLEVELPDAIIDGDQITANIGCSSPWEVDSNPDDNERSLVVSGESGLDENTQNALTGTIAALVIILILWAIGFTHPESNKKRIRKINSKSQKDSENSKIVQDETSEEVDDTIHLDDNPQVDIEETDFDDNEIIEIIEEIDENPEEPVEVVEQDELSRLLEGVTDPFERKLIELEYRREQRSKRRR